MFSYRALILVLLGCPAVALAEDPTKGPSRDRFSLKIEKKRSKTLEIIRFHLTVHGNRTVRFHIGRSGYSSQNLKPDPKRPELQQLTVTLELKLRDGKKPGSSIINRLLRFEGKGISGIQTNYDVPQRKTLAGALTLTGKSGLYPVGKQIVLGHFLTKKIVIEAR